MTKEDSRDGMEYMLPSQIASHICSALVSERCSQSTVSQKERGRVEGDSYLSPGGLYHGLLVRHLKRLQRVDVLDDPFGSHAAEGGPARKSALAAKLGAAHAQSGTNC